MLIENLVGAFSHKRQRGHEYTADQLGVMDYLGIDKFMVMGFCIGGPSSGTS